jgi:hypothetical protein
MEATVILFPSTIQAPTKIDEKRHCHPERSEGSVFVLPDIHGAQSFAQIN